MGLVLLESAWWLEIPTTSSLLLWFLGCQWHSCMPTARCAGHIPVGMCEHELVEALVTMDFCRAENKIAVGRDRTMDPMQHATVPGV